MPARLVFPDSAAARTYAMQQDSNEGADGSSTSTTDVAADNSADGSGLSSSSAAVLQGSPAVVLQGSPAAAAALVTGRMLQPPPSVQRAALQPDDAAVAEAAEGQLPGQDAEGGPPAPIREKAAAAFAAGTKV